MACVSPPCGWGRNRRCGLCRKLRMNSLRLHAEVLSSRVHTLAFSRQMASLRSFARSLSGLTRCKTPKLLSLGMGARACDSKDGGGAHFEQAVRPARRRRWSASAERRVRLGMTGGLPEVVTLHVNCTSVSVVTRRRHRVYPLGMTAGSSVTSLRVWHTPSEAVLRVSAACSVRPSEASYLYWNGRKRSRMWHSRFPMSEALEKSPPRLLPSRRVPFSAGQSSDMWQTLAVQLLSSGGKTWLLNSWPSARRASIVEKREQASRLLAGTRHCDWGVSFMNGHAQNPLLVLYLPRNSPLGARRMVGWAVSPPWMRWNRWRALCGLGIVGEKSELFPA